MNTADDRATTSATSPPHGQRDLTGNRPFPMRRELSPDMAALLLKAHHQTGMTYRQAAAVIGIDAGYWCRLTHGRRAPSRRTAIKIIHALGLDDGAAAQLMRESVDDREFVAEHTSGAAGLPL